MTAFCQWAIVVAVLSLTAVAQSGNVDFIKKNPSHPSSIATHRHPASVPVPKSQSPYPSAKQELNQIEHQALHASSPSTAKNSNTRRPTPAPTPAAANGKNRNMNFKYQAPKSNSAPTFSPAH